jgi:hypothetical protein
MKRSPLHTITAWAVFVSFISYSIYMPAPAYASEPQPTADQPIAADAPAVAIPACNILGISSLDLVLPTIGSSGQIYDIGTRYRIVDTTTTQQLPLEGTFLHVLPRRVF